MKRKRFPAQQSFKFPFSRQGVVQRRGANATKKSLGAGEGAYLAGLLHVFVWYVQCNKRGPPGNRFTCKTLCRCRMKKKCTGKLQMKRIGFSDKRSHRIKE